MTTVGALVGGVKVRTRPGLVGLPPGEGPVPPVPARILASLSATEGPVDVPAACCGAGVGPAVVGCTAVGQNKNNENGVWWGLRDWKRRGVQQRLLRVLVYTSI